MIFETLAPHPDDAKLQSSPRRQSLNMAVPFATSPVHLKEEPRLLLSTSASMLRFGGRRSSYDGTVPFNGTNNKQTETQITSNSRDRQSNRKPRANSEDDIYFRTVKYITGESGVRRLNPAWEEAQQAKLAQEKSQAASTTNNGNSCSSRASTRKSFVLYPFVNRSTALPIVSYPSQEDLFDDLTVETFGSGDTDHGDDKEDDANTSDKQMDSPNPKSTKSTTVQPTSSYEDAIRDYQSQWHFQALQEYENLTALNEYEDITRSTSFTESDDHGYNAQMQHELQEILERYEVPAGMLSKLLGLQEFAAAEILVDDSIDMNKPSDVVDVRLTPNKKQNEKQAFLTRWAEAKERIMQMMELVAYIPTPPAFFVRFLNRQDIIELKRQPREAPQDFLDRVQRMLDTAFDKVPQEGDGSPALERIRESFHRHHKKHTDGVLRYFMSHGVPDGGEEECQKIVHLLMHRAQPQRNPFTFLSCTDQDGDAEWMKSCEETAPHCSEFDDYMDESREILQDQGKAFPYSYGLHLVGQLVAAFNPDDLDAMDESVPFPKRTLADLLGYKLSDAEYKYYFDSFLEAQHKLWSSLEQYRKEFIHSLPRLYRHFERVSTASEIVEVRNFRRRLKADSPIITLTTTNGSMSADLAEQCTYSPQRRWPRLFRENSLQRLFGSKNHGQEHPSSPSKKKTDKFQKRMST